MKHSELKTQDDAELAFLLKEKRKRMFDLRFKAASEEISDTKELSRLRRDVARILMLQGERTRAAAAKKVEAKTDAKS